MSPTRCVVDIAEHYIHGLMHPGKKNMERMAEKVPESNEQSYQHFISNSPWDHRLVINQVSIQADQILGGHENSALMLDDSGFVKKGEKSVAVQRQWIGRLGKTDNCQTAVFAALSCDYLAIPINTRLYLPKSWTDDKKRCVAAGVPVEHIVLKTKHELAIEMVAEARTQGVRFNWVGFDGGYGKDPAFLRTLDDTGEIFVGDVHKNQHIYLEDPKPSIPPPKRATGRKSQKLKAQSSPVRVDVWAQNQPAEAWQKVLLRSSTKGEIVVEVLHRDVWLWEDEEPTPRLWRLIVRREIEQPDEIKYTLSNAGSSVSIERLAFMQGQRFWIERSFQDAKSNCGMADYQVRGWRGWHHHMAMVMLAMLFMVKERLHHQDTLPLLSVADIVVVMSVLLPRKDSTAEEVYRQLMVRHQKRLASIRSAYKKQQEKPQLSTCMQM